MKKIYLFLLLIAGLAFSPVKAQLTIDTTGLMEAYLQSEYIFEGVVVSQCVYQDDGNNIYTTNIIEISKIIKGDLTCGTVALVTMGGTMPDGSTLTLDHQIQFNVGVAGMFLANDLTYPYTQCEETTNTQPLMLTYAAYGSFEYLFDLVNDEVVGFNSTFPTIESFYEFLTSIGINIIYCNGSIIEQVRAKGKHITLPHDKIMARIPTKPTDKQKTSLTQKMASNQSHVIDRDASSQKAGETIEYLITKANLAGSVGSEYYDIDISVKSNVNTTFLEGVSFRLKYNPNTFGTNVNSAITTTATLSSYYDYISPDDFNDSILEISIFSTFSGTPFRTQVTTAPLKVLNIHIPVTNCKYYPNLKIDTFANAKGFSIFSTSASSSSLFYFSNYIMGAFRKGVVCDPNVVSRSQDSVAGGIKEQFTIYGEHFGAAKGKVYMTSADVSDSPYYALDEYDYTWADDHITVTNPSFADSGAYVGGAYTKGTVGSGYIKLIDAYGNMYLPTSLSTEPSKIQVKYVVWNQSKGTSSGKYKNNQFLYSANSDGKYHFKLASNITDPDMIATIKAAFRRWSCASGVPFVLDNGTVTAAVDSDGVNQICLATYPSGSSVLATTHIRASSACSTSPTTAFATAEIDISINNAFLSQFQYDTTGNINIASGKTDFFKTIMHELGHGHLLGHVNNSHDFMYRRIDPGPLNAINRYVNFTGYNFQASDYVATNSAISANGLTCVYNLPISLQTITCRNTLLGINDVTEKVDVVDVYPNPFQDAITVLMNAQVNQICTIHVYNQLGQTVALEQRNAHKGDNAFTLADLGLTNGIYYVSIQTGNTTYSVKLVCIR